MCPIKLSRKKAINHLLDRLFKNKTNDREKSLRRTFEGCDNEVLKSFLHVLPEFRKREIDFISELEQKVEDV